LNPFLKPTGTERERFLLKETREAIEGVELMPDSHPPIMSQTHKVYKSMSD